MEDASWTNRSLEPGKTPVTISETRVIAGRPAFVTYSPPGPNYNPGAMPSLWIHDPETDVHYVIRGRDGALLGGPPDLLITIAASLFHSE